MRYQRVLSMAGPKRPWMAAGALLMLSLIAGCGSQYRTVVTPVTTSGPAAQYVSYAVVVTAPCTSAVATTCSSAVSTANSGAVTLLDYSGDTIVDQALVGPNPVGYAMDGSSTYGHTLNADKTISTFAPSISLQTKDVELSTLSTSTNTTVSNYTNYLAYNSSTLYVIDNASNAVDVMPGTPPAIEQTVSLNSTGTTGLVNLVGATSISRIYAVSQNIAGSDCDTPASVTVNGSVTAIDPSSNTTIGSSLTVGKCPVYGVMSSDGKRVFIMNRGSGTVSVINSQTNAIDSKFPNGITVGAGPVYAEFIPNTNYLVVANYDSSTLSVINTSLDVYGNDSSDFGKVVATVTDSSLNHPASVTILADGSRAYVANKGSGTTQSDGSVKGTVSVVNLTTYSVTKTLSVYGSPRTVISGNDSLYGKVYVIAPDTKYCTVIRTDEDIVSTAILLPGYGVDGRMTKVSATLSNPVLSSRQPGRGQP